MKTFILALATAVPSIQLDQQQIAQDMINLLDLQHPISTYITSIYQRSAINHRHTVIEDDFAQPSSTWKFWGNKFPERVPSTKIRNELYKEKAPDLALSACKKALLQWNGNVQDITHVIAISCTGIMAPGIEFHLIDSLGLNRTVNRLGINFMGCFGAFAGLKVAHALAQQDPRNRILMVCVELCTLHLQVDASPETLVANALFADGAAAVIVGSQPTHEEKPIYEIVRNSSYALPNSLDEMTWQPSNTGFVMKLSQDIAKHIEQSIAPFAQSLLADLPFSDCSWALHPGGKAIVRSIERACNLSAEQTQSSWNVLRDYGNMSSPTFLFVLDEVRKQPKKYDWSAGLSFGPRFSIEGILLKNVW